jgi:copper(I)-binding protein
MTMLKSIALAACLACASGVAAAADYTQGTITVGNPWARATPKGAPVAGGYLTITNKGTAPDRLVGGSVPFAGRFEVHEMATEQGVMRMRPVGTGGLEIKPGETVELKPGGLHVMFLDLKRALLAGEHPKATLVFERAGTVEVEFAVAPIGAPGPTAGVKPAGAAHTGH